MAIIESHRKAFMTRLNFVEFPVEHDGETEFPYDAADVAHYLYDLLLSMDSHFMIDERQASFDEENVRM